MAHSRSDEALGASYRLVERIGSGAVGDVWRVTTTSGETLAAKLLKPEHADDPALVERFVRERSVLLSLRHPNIVQVRDLVVEGDRLAIVMDHVPGGSVRDIVLWQSTVAPRDALELTAEVCDALTAAHAHGVVHRDVKPDNVLLNEPWRPGLTGAARVTDFGIASVLGERVRRTTGLIGTPQYMAPELISHGRSGPAVDVYAAGVMLYELLAGRTPFAGPGTDFTIAYRHVTASPPPLEVPGELWQALETLLSKDPQERPPATEAAALLRRLARDVGDLPALAPAAAPDEFDESDRPATVVRGGMSGSQTSTETRLPPMLPDDAPELGAPGSATVVRPLQRPEPPLRRPEEDEEDEEPRPPWWRSTVALVVAGCAILGAVIVGAVTWILPSLGQGDSGEEDPVPTAITAQQQDPPLPTGLSVARQATYDPEAGSVSLTVTYSAQAAPLSGPILEVVPGPTSEDPCPPVDWREVSASRNQPSLTSVTTPCGWSLDAGEIPPGEQISVEAVVPMTLEGSEALDEWLADAAAATAAATSDPQATGTAYPVQRLQGVEVRTPSRTVSQTTLEVTLLPVWPGGADEMNPLYASPATGRPSQMLQAIAGGENGVRFADGCSGALAVSSDGLTVTALSVTPQCVVRASVGNFSNLESAPFAITTREED